MTSEEFVSFPKIPRLNSEVLITEKIDGTNAQIYITFAELEAPPVYKHLTDVGTLNVYAGSRNRYLTVDNDNFGFAKWARENGEELIKLGEGRHFGEWWGKGIQRGYGLEENRFSLFNVFRWHVKETPPACCHVVPVLDQRVEGFSDLETLPKFILRKLKEEGSYAAPGYKNPEGIVVCHMRSKQLFKLTIDQQKGKCKKEYD